MKVDIRPAKREEVDWLADLFTRSMRDAIAATRGSWDIAREDAQFRRQLQLPDTRVIRVENNGVGFLTTRALPNKSLEVHTLCIEPDWQCAGIGTHVMREIMAAARAASSSIVLSVLKANTRARLFYERLGFVEIGTSTHHVRMRWSPDT